MIQLFHGISSQTKHFYNIYIDPYNPFENPFIRDLTPREGGRRISKDVNLIGFFTSSIKTCVSLLGISKNTLVNNKEFSVICTDNNSEYGDIALHVAELYLNSLDKTNIDPKKIIALNSIRLIVNAIRVCYVYVNLSEECFSVNKGEVAYSYEETVYHSANIALELLEILDALEVLNNSQGLKEN
ncbi:MAG: hypothetical protein Tsb0021_04460 [Chlamydiales bacterium]